MNGHVKILWKGTVNSKFLWVSWLLNKVLVIYNCEDIKKFKPKLKNMLTGLIYTVVVAFL